MAANWLPKGPPDFIANHKSSLTGAYLSGRMQIPLPKKRRNGSGPELKIVGAQENNLKDVDIRIPLGRFVCVTGC